MKQVTVLAPAKINLALDVTGVRQDGYHTLDMIMQAVNLYEVITLRKGVGVKLKCNVPYVPCNEKNTAHKAARLFFEYAKIDGGVDITIEKHVPVKAGMAGGSADAAGVLVGLNMLYGTGLSVEQLCELGIKIGADVPFAIKGGTARVKGIGEEITPLKPFLYYYITVVMPSAGISTPAAFKRYDELGTDIRPDCDKLQKAIESYNLEDMCKEVKNSLQFSSAAKDTDAICKALNENGALASMMTGSGAAVFGIYSSQEKALQAKNILSKTYEQTFCLEPISGGVKFKSL